MSATSEPERRRYRVSVDGGELAAEAFGDASHPVLLHIAGAMAAMDCWEDEWCRRLAADGRRVVRYDHRDTGASVAYDYGRPPYGFEDLVADAVALLDTLGAERAHIVGMSLGGGIGQLLAIEHRHRVASLTLASCSPGLRPATPPPADLPGMVPEIAEQYADPSARTRHNHMLLDPGAPYRARLAEITVPTLVLHGADDPLFPPAHGEALAKEIHGAGFQLLTGVGHEVPPRRTWADVLPAIRRHTA